MTRHRDSLPPHAYLRAHSLRRRPILFSFFSFFFSLASASTTIDLLSPAAKNSLEDRLKDTYVKGIKHGGGTIPPSLHCPSTGDHVLKYSVAVAYKVLHASHTPATMTHNHANYQGRLDFIQNLLCERFNLQVICLHVFLRVQNAKNIRGSCPDHSHSIRRGMSFQVQQLCLPHQLAFACLFKPQSRAAKAWYRRDPSRHQGIYISPYQFRRRGNEPEDPSRK